MSKASDYGKGDAPRPRQISREEYDLRWDFMSGVIDFDEFMKRLHLIESEE